MTVRLRTPEQVEADLAEAARLEAEKLGVAPELVAGKKLGGPPTSKYPVYATVGDVEALNRARSLGANNTPSTEDVQLFLEWSAAEINEILANKGYEVPIQATSTSANMLLSAINAKGAVVQVEKGSPTSTKLEKFEAEYETDLDKLRSADFTLDAPLAVERARPRGPGLTVPQSTGLESAPFFTRSKEF